MAEWPDELADHLLGAEILADMAEGAMGVELLAVIGDDAGRLLAAMLQRVQAKRHQRRRLGDGRRRRTRRIPRAGDRRRTVVW